MFLKNYASMDCKVEAYGTQREFRTETCKLKLPFAFVSVWAQREFGTEICKLKLPFPFVPPTFLLYLRSVVFLKYFY